MRVSCTTATDAYMYCVWRIHKREQNIDDDKDDATTKINLKKKQMKLSRNKKKKNNTKAKQMRNCILNG